MIYTEDHGGYSGPCWVARIALGARSWLRGAIGGLELSGYVRADRVPFSVRKGLGFIGGIWLLLGSMPA